MTRQFFLLRYVSKICPPYLQYKIKRKGEIIKMSNFSKLLKFIEYKGKAWHFRSLKCHRKQTNTHKH